MINRRRLPIDLLALGLLGLVVFVGLALWSFDPADPPGDAVYPPSDEVTNLMGGGGAVVANNLRNLLGWGAWLVPLSLGSCGISWLMRNEHDRPLQPLAGWILLVGVGCTTLRALAPDLSGSPLMGSGGLLGAWIWATLYPRFQEPGITLLLSTLTAAGVILVFDRWTARSLLALIVGPYLLFQKLGFGLADEHAANPVEPARTPAWSDTTVPAASPPTAPVPTPVAVAAVREAIPVRVAEPILSGASRAAEPPSLQLPVGITPSIQHSPVATPGEDLPVSSFETRTPASAAAAEETLPSLEGPPKLVEPPIGVVRDLASAAGSNPEEEPLASPDSVDDELSASPPTATTPAPIRINPPRDLSLHQGARVSPPIPPREYNLPTAALLEPAEPFPFEALAEKARGAAAILERTFQEFGLNVRVVEIDTGPVITQFELELEAGLRLNKVTALADDLAIALRVPSVRVVAPIPGKNTVGVEVPNDRQVMVRLRELIEASPDAGDKKRIPVFLGKDVSGRPLVVDLAKMPHLLIAGRTGTGKSVCLNALILSILMTRTPEEVKMLMIDPKMVELSPYKRVPHLMHPVITDMKKAEAVLGWAVDKMEERYDLLARCGVRHLDSYNELGRDTILRKLGLDPNSEEADQVPERMPYIVIIADEMADMMMTSGKEVEGFIIRLAQKSRAVGIHLVLATQKPTVDVITGLIKSNLPARIAFQVASRVDSRVVLDEMGAERLLGNGDMLYLIPGTSKMTRAQGTYVSDNEVNSVIEFFGDCEPEYSRELAQLSTRGKGKSGIDAIRSRDEMYEQAIDVVVREGRGSVSLLQRALGIGYGRAARLIDYMAEDGIVGDYNGSQAREVLYTPEQWAELVAGGNPTAALQPG
ncbi:MAG: DNA translocase FtsK 4TM domain-containing protein [Planctomycetaceae bacterium]